MTCYSVLLACVASAALREPTSIVLHHTVVNVTTGAGSEGASLQVFYRPNIGPASVALFESPPGGELVAFGSGTLDLVHTIKNGELNYNKIPNITRTSRLHPIKKSSDVVFENVTSTNAVSSSNTRSAGEHDASAAASVTLNGHLTHPTTKEKVNAHLFGKSSITILICLPVTGTFHLHAHLRSQSDQPRIQCGGRLW